MSIRSLLSALTFLLFSPYICKAQELDEKILMNIAGQNILAGEFIRMYEKSIYPGVPNDLNNYLEQFIIFKLKVTDAISEGYDTTAAFRKEFKGYRDQLAEYYLTDKNIKEKLLHDTCKRSLTEVNAMIRKSMTEKLKNDYGFRLNPAALGWFIKNTDTLIISGKSKYNRSEISEDNLYSFADQHLNMNLFAEYVEKNSPSPAADKDKIEDFIMNHLETILYDQMIKYEDSILEQKYPEFRYLMKEFYDGILLFNISSDKVWNRSQTDTSGLLSYYKNNINKYPDDFKEVPGELVSDYQDWLMDEWIKQLKDRYAVKVRMVIFNKIRRKLTNE